MPLVALYLFGTPRVEYRGQVVQIRRRKAMALLVYLAVTGQVHSRDALATLFWPESDQSTARAGLRRALAAIKSAVGDECLEVDRESLGLRLKCLADGRLWLDVRTFSERLALCRQHPHAPDGTCSECLPLLTEAATLYLDDFLSGFTLPDAPAFDEWQFFEAQRLRDALAGVLARLSETYVENDDYEQGIVCARRWVSLDPLHEPAQRCLMRAYAHAGQRTAAVRQYETCVRVLDAELGVCPENETVRLYRDILQHWGDGGSDLSTSRHSSVLRSNAGNLPAQLTPFVGRETAIEEICRRLVDPDCRLLTVTGPGGIGKTRLALEVAGRLLGAWPDGAFFVPLVPLRSADAIVPAVARALAFSFARRGDPERQLLDHLAGKQLLLVLDNLEHLVLGSGSEPRSASVVVTRLLEASSSLTILATSRTRLYVYGEHLFELRGMETAVHKDFLEASSQGDQGDAIELYVKSAQRAQAYWTAGSRELGHITEICRLVEGLPLAIEMAAAWTGVLGPAEIAAEIRDSLDILGAATSGVPAEGIVGGERHRSIRVVFDHSWALLNSREQEFFAALSVFRGSFDRGAAQAVTGVSLHELAGLVDKSLLSAAAESRFQMHELLRRYASEKLASSPAGRDEVCERHSAYYLALARTWAPSDGPPRLSSLWAVQDIEVENVRVAWDWAAERLHIDRLSSAIGGLLGYYNAWSRRWPEGEDACRFAVDRLSTLDDSPQAVRLSADLCAWRGLFALKMGKEQLARDLLREGLSALTQLGVGAAIADAVSCALLQMGLVLSRAKATGYPVAFLLADIDNFRLVNNTFGHSSGDRVLEDFWELWWQSVPKDGLAFRWGGEELVMLLPGMDADSAMVYAENIRQRMQDHVCLSVDGREVRVTISIGVAVYPHDADNLIALHMRADQAAIRAKSAGKNRVCVSSGSV